MTALDRDLALASYRWASASPAAAAAVIAIARYGIFALAAIVAVLWLAPGADRLARRQVVIAAAISVALAVALVLGLDLIGGLGRARPFVALGIVPLLPHAADASFPSDHALVSAAAAWPILARRWVAGLIGLLVVALVGGARVAAGVHYPSDVVGSALLAVPLGAAGLAMAGVVPNVPVVGRLLATPPR